LAFGEAPAVLPIALFMSPCGTNQQYSHSEQQSYHQYT